MRNANRFHVISVNGAANFANLACPYDQKEEHMIAALRLRFLGYKLFDTTCEHKIDSSFSNFGGYVPHVGVEGAGM
jgi:hypothetical protein